MSLDNTLVHGPCSVMRGTMRCYCINWWRTFSTTDLESSPVVQILATTSSKKDSTRASGKWVSTPLPVRVGGWRSSGEPWWGQFIVHTWLGWLGGATGMDLWCLSWAWEEAMGGLKPHLRFNIPIWGCHSWLWIGSREAPGSKCPTQSSNHFLPPGFLKLHLRLWQVSPSGTVCASPQIISFNAVG